MKDRPILFSAPMVRALLEGRKTQTRRIVKPLTKRHPIKNLAEHGRGRGDKNGASTYSGRFNDPASWGYPYAEDGEDMALADWISVLCPYGKPGDLLWARESWYCDDYRVQSGPYLKPDDLNVAEALDNGVLVYGADGLQPYEQEQPTWKPSIHMPRWASRLTLRITDVRVQRLQGISEADAQDEGVDRIKDKVPMHRDSYIYLWDDINGPGSWAANPWVWALTFEVIEQNVDAYLASGKAAIAAES